MKPSTPHRITQLVIRCPRRGFAALGVISLAFALGLGSEASAQEHLYGAWPADPAREVTLQRARDPQAELRRRVIEGELTAAWRRESQQLVAAAQLWLEGALVRASAARDAGDVSAPVRQREIDEVSTMLARWSTHSQAIEDEIARRVERVAPKHLLSRGELESRLISVTRLQFGDRLTGEKGLEEWALRVWVLARFGIDDERLHFERLRERGAGLERWSLAEIEFAPDRLGVRWPIWRQLFRPLDPRAAEVAQGWSFAAAFGEILHASYQAQAPMVRGLLPGLEPTESLVALMASAVVFGIGPVLVGDMRAQSRALSELREDWQRAQASALSPTESSELARLERVVGVGIEQGRAIPSTPQTAARFEAALLKQPVVAAPEQWCRWAIQSADDASPLAAARQLRALITRSASTGPEIKPE